MLMKELWAGRVPVCIRAGQCHDEGESLYLLDLLATGDVVPVKSKRLVRKNGAERRVHATERWSKLDKAPVPHAFHQREVWGSTS